MDYMFASEECSSGCESGWTLYLDHSSISPNDRKNNRSRRVFSDATRLKEEDEEEEEEDEDLSMVSDASSGPPHVHEEDGNHGNNGCFNRYSTDHDALMSRNRKKNRDINRRRNNNNNKVQDRDTLLDDTASSPFFDFSNVSPC